MALKNRSGISNEEMKKKLEAQAGPHADPIVADTAVPASIPTPTSAKTGRLGRKKTEEKKTVGFAVYFSEKEADAIKAFCSLENRSASSWIRMIALQVLRENENFDI